jgi:hypothetical protein
MTKCRLRLWHLVSDLYRLKRLDAAFAIWFNPQSMTASTTNHQTLMEILTVYAIVCISHAVIGISAHFHQASFTKSGHPARKAIPPSPLWLRWVQLGFGLLCLFLACRFTTRQERNWLCVWLVLVSLTPIVAGALGYFGIKSPWLIHTLVIVLSAGCLVYYVIQMM